MIHLKSIINSVFLTSYIRMKFFLRTSSLITPQKSLISLANRSNNSNDIAGCKLNLDVPTIYNPWFKHKKVPPLLMWANWMQSTANNGLASPEYVFAYLKNVSGVDLGKSDLKSRLMIVSPLGDRMNIYENIIIYIYIFLFIMHQALARNSYTLWTSLIFFKAFLNALLSINLSSNTYLILFSL